MLSCAALVQRAGAWEACQPDPRILPSFLGPKPSSHQSAALGRAVPGSCSLVAAAVTVRVAQAPKTQRRARRKNRHAEASRAAGLEDLAEALVQAVARAEAAEAREKEMSESHEALKQEVVNLRASKQRIIQAQKIGGTTGVTQAIEAAEARIEELEFELAQLSEHGGGSREELREAQQKAAVAETRAQAAELREADILDKYKNDKALVLERSRKAFARKEDAKRRAKKRRDEEEQKAWEEADKRTQEKTNTAVAAAMVVETESAKGQFRQKALERLEREDLDNGDQAQSHDQEPAETELAQKVAKVQAELEEVNTSIEMQGDKIRKKKNELRAAGKSPEQVNKNEAVQRMVKQLERLKEKHARLDRAAKKSLEELNTSDEAEAEPVELDPAWEEAQEDLELLRSMMEKRGFSQGEIDADPDVRAMEKELLQYGADPSRPERAFEWHLPQKHKTQKERLTDWYHRKYERRTGRAGTHFLNKAAGKSMKDKRRIAKEYIKKKIRAESKAERQQRREANAGEDDPFSKMQEVDLLDAGVEEATDTKKGKHAQ